MTRKKPIDKPVPERAADGEFTSFQEWVNKATSWIGGTNPACWDAQNRRCRIGADFMRARDEGTFPVRFWFDEGDETFAQKQKSQRQTRKLIGAWKFDMREAMRR